MKPMYWCLTILFLLSAGVVEAQGEDLLEEMYREAKELYYDGDYEAAATALENILSQKRAEGSRDEFLMRVLMRSGKNERYLRRHEAALAYLQEGLDLATELHGENSEETADVMYEIGSVYSQMYNLPEADRWFTRCLDIYREKYGAESIEVGYMYMNFGINALKEGAFPDAEKHFQRTLAIFNEAAEPESEEFNRIYSNLGYLYRKVGRYEQAIDYGDRALEIKLLHYPPDHPGVAKYHRNLGRAWQDRGNPERALSFMQRTVEILEASLGSDHPTTGGSYGELADVYADLGEYDRALELYNRASDIQSQTMPLTHPYRIAGTFNVGRLYEEMGDYPAALQYYEQTLAIFQSADFAPPQYLALTRRKLADVYLQNERAEDALRQLQEGMQQLVPGFRPDPADLYANPELVQVQSPIDLLQLLMLKGEALELRFANTERESDAVESFRTRQLAVRLSDDIRRGYVSEEDGVQFAAFIQELLEDAVRQAYELYQRTGEGHYLREAFRLSDKGKSGMLWQHLHAEQALLAADVPPALRDSLQLLEARIARMEEQLADSPEEETYRNLTAAKITYAELIRSLETHDPAYYRLKYAPSDVHPEDLGARLQNNGAALLSYFYDENHVYIFLIKAGEEVQVFRRAHDGQLEVVVQRLHEIHRAALSEDERYLAQLQKMYDWLIAPVHEQLEPEQPLVLIPYGILNYLSFEILADPGETTDYRQLDYLIRRHPIQYDWSAAFLLETDRTPTNPELPYVGFAPDFGDGNRALAYRAALAPLPFAPEEVGRAAAALGGDKFLGADATEEQFRRVSSRARVLHLATHAVLDDENPLFSGLAFTRGGEGDDFLRALEIYNMQIPARLAVISACNTGAGQLQRGEGVMSLARAFAYAGCESTVMSLWPANDASTAALVDDFFTEVAAGTSPEIALRRAKLNYLDQADGLTAQPYFWGHLVLVGQAADESGYFAYWWGLLLILVLAGVGLLLMRQGKY